MSLSKALLLGANDATASTRDTLAGDLDSMSRTDSAVSSSPTWRTTTATAGGGADEDGIVRVGSSGAVIPDNTFPFLRFYCCRQDCRILIAASWSDRFGLL
jgi:hypothetical protein